MNNRIKTIIIIAIIFILMYFSSDVANGCEIYAGVEKQIEESTKYLWLNEKEIEDIQKTAIAEAETEGICGMAYVMKVIYNRIESEHFPDSVECVLSQDNQFECMRNGMFEKAIPNEQSKMAYLMSLTIQSDALYFENDHGKENTWHNKNLKLLFKYKKHKFYE